MQVEANRVALESLDVQALAVAVFKNEKSDGKPAISTSLATTN